MCEDQKTAIASPDSASSLARDREKACAPRQRRCQWRVRGIPQLEQPVGTGKQGGYAEARPGEPDNGDALALTFAKAVAPLEVEERDEEDAIGARDCIPCGPASSSRAALFSAEWLVAF